MRPFHSIPGGRPSRLSPKIRSWIGVLCLGGTAVAGQTVVQNDSVVDFGQAAIQAGFVADERGAAWLTAPCTGEMTAVQILWLSLTGGAGDTLGERITISAAGTFPVPGAADLELVGPVMTDGFFNEFPVNPAIPWVEDEVMVVDFKFLTSPPVIGPSLVTDTDGCQAAKNGIFAIPPSVWFDACVLGVSGDLAIRAVISCGDTEIFVDGFESGDTAAWSTTTSAPDPGPRPFPIRRADPRLSPFWTRPVDPARADGR